MITLLVAFGIAVVVAGITRLAAVGILQVNGFAGLRTPETMSSQAAWQRGHAAAFPVSVVTVFAAAFACAAVFFAAPDDGLDAYGLIPTGVSVAGAIAAAIRAHLAANRA